MDYRSFKELLTSKGAEALQAATYLAPRESDYLFHFQSLSMKFPPDLTRAALETAILRGEALVKFPFANRLFFTRQALEQASSAEISTYRAERYRSFAQVADLGCSIGGDTFALARIAPIFSVDNDVLRLAMAGANLQALGLAEKAQLIQADLAFPLPFKRRSTALFFDPGRRSNQRRIFSVQQYLPPLSIIQQWLPGFPALGVKISPGVDLAELAGYDAEIEFVSFRGELKEAVLWFGPLKSVYVRATVLPGPHQLVTLHPNQPVTNFTEISDPKAYLYEPDPAVIRSGLVTTLAGMLDASLFDPDIAYLTADTYHPTPFARAWQIEDWFSFQLKRLRTYLRQHHIGQVTVKKRGSPLEPDFLIQQLRLQGELERVIVLTQLRHEPIVLICIRV